MADNLIFPIGFDLDKAVADAGTAWSDTYAEKLEKRIAKKPVNVALKFDVTQLNSLDKVKQRLAQLKIEPITPETKSAIEQLAAELQTLAKALEQVQKYSAARAAADPSAVRAARINEINTRAEAKAKVEAEKAAVQAAKAEKLLADARLKDARAAQVNEKTTRNASKAYSEQSTYLQRLTQRMAAYWSIQQVGNFLTNVREVTAQFELQRVSLGAIIQDQTRANQLFSEIKNFALKSPVKIMDLTKYTKQLAAYKIETEELFETTKKLTDVSVGLDVSMDRVVLAYGQTRATGYLRASEIRQFTEMGVPIVEELAAKLSKMNGELVTAADVMDMVSKRGISFELVKEVFDDMTSAGGMFYNMQEKQGNTLFGMWAKLGDAASVMYDKIGRSETVNKGMKETIQLLTDMMRNWEMVARYIGYASVVIAGFVIRKKILGIETAKIAAIQQTYNARMMQANMLAASNSRLIRAQGVAMGVYAQSMRFASTMAAAFGTSLQAIKSALITTGWGALIVALGYIADKLFLTKTNAEKAAEAFNNVWSETRTQQDQSVRNFEYLADKAVKAAAGSREQKEALEELQRTYKSILPQEVLELEYLEKLKGNYGSLTQAIREYVAERQKQKGIDEIADVYGAEKRKYESQLTDFFRESGLSEQEIARFWERFYKIAGDKSKSLPDIVADALQSAGVKGISADLIQKSLLSSQGLLSEFNKSTYNKLGVSFGDVDYIDLLRDAILAENQALEQNSERAKAATESTNEFSKKQEEAANRLKNVRFVTASGANIDRDSDLGQQMLKNFEIKDMTNMLKDGFEQAGLAWDKEYGNFIKHVNAKTPELISNLNFKAITDALIKALDNPELSEAQRKYLQDLLSFAQKSQLRYNEIMPSDPVVRTWQTRFRQIAQSVGGFRQQYNQYLMKAGEDMETYNKRLKDTLADLKNRVRGLLDTQKVIAKAGIFAKALYGVSVEELQKNIDETNKTIDVIEKTLAEQSDYSKKKPKGGKKDDPRLGILQEMVSTLKQVNKEYDELAKKEGATRALTDTQKVYDATFKNMQSLAKKYKFSLPKLDVPTDTKSLTDYLNKIREAMKKLPKSDKAVLALQVDIDKLDIDEQQRKIEEQLKRLSDNVSRTKTAQEFYTRILGTTGDVDLAMNVTTAIYGDAGTDVQSQMAEYVKSLFGQVDVEIPMNIISEDGTIDYTAMEKYVKGNEKILGKSYTELLKIARDGQKNLAKTYEGYLKDLEVAKTYADKRVQLARDTANKIAEIQKDPNMDKKQKDYLIAGYNERESRESAKLEYEAFKDTPLYVKMFGDLENASTHALKRMRDKLIDLKGQWKNLGPTQLKELQNRLDDLNNQISSRNPFKTIVDSFKKLRNMRKNGRTREVDNIAADEAEKQRKIVREKMLADDKDYQMALNKYGAESNITKEKRKQVDASKREYEEAEENANKTEEQSEEWDNINEKIADALAELKKYQEYLNDAFGGIRDIMETFGASEEDIQFFDDVVGGFNQIYDAGLKAGDAYLMFTEGDYFGAITSGVSAVGGLISGVSNIFSAGKVRRANKEIKRQQEIIDKLEYSYGRLQKAQEKAFGSDYIQNYYQQQKNLQAQLAAKEKQLAAERSKGKKKDKEAIKQYNEQIRDLKDQIAELNGQLGEYFLGTDITSAARDFAVSWIEAKKSFDDTSEALKEKFKDMVQNMVVEAMAGKIMENALQPFYTAIDKASEDGVLSADEIAKASKVGLTAIGDMNAGMEVLWQELKKAGLDVNKILGDKKDGYTGIAKDVAGATSEEINAVASIGNTVMYHTSFLPLIYQQLVAQAGGNVTQPTMQTSTGWTDWQQQAMTSYLAIQQNTADTVVECRRSAQACENIANQLSRVVRTKGSITGVNTFLNS